MSNDYVYCKSGFNIIRIPSFNFYSKHINPENVEVLMWQNGGERVFKRNDLSDLICNEDNIFALESSNKLDDLIDEEIEEFIKMYKETHRTSESLPQNRLFKVADYYGIASKDAYLQSYKASTKAASTKRLMKSLKKKQKSPKKSLEYKYGK